VLCRFFIFWKGKKNFLKDGDCIIHFNKQSILKTARTLLHQYGKESAIIFGDLPPETKREQIEKFNDPEVSFYFNFGGKIGDFSYFGFRVLGIWAYLRMILGTSKVKIGGFFVEFSLINYSLFLEINH